MAGGSKKLHIPPSNILGYGQFASNLGGCLALTFDWIKDSHLTKQADEK